MVYLKLDALSEKKWYFLYTYPERSIICDRYLTENVDLFWSISSNSCFIRKKGSDFLGDWKFEISSMHDLCFVLLCKAELIDQDGTF